MDIPVSDDLSRPRTRQSAPHSADRLPLTLAVALTLAGSLGIQLIEEDLLRVMVGIVVTIVLLGSGVWLRGQGRDSLSGDAVLALGALSVFGWVSAIITAIPAVRRWIETAPPSASFLVVNSMKLSSAVVLLAIMATYGWSRQQMLLSRGKLNAPTGFPYVRWGIAGPLVIIVVVALFLTDPAVLNSIGDPGEIVGLLVGALPPLLAGPLVNAVCEELLYRHALIATMRPIIGAGGALVISSMIFGLGHITGTPGGWVGVLFTLAYGLVSGLAMLQNRGTAWNTTIHVVADLAALTTIIVISAGAPPG